MSDHKSFDEPDSRSGGFDLSAVASLFEHAGVGYDREEDRPFSRFPPPPDAAMTADTETLDDLADADTHVDDVPAGRDTGFPVEEVDTAVSDRTELPPT